MSTDTDVFRSSFTRRCGAVLGVALVAAGVGALGDTGPAAAQSGGSFVRGVGTTRIDSTRASGINILGLVCGAVGTAGDGSCAAQASATMTVDASTKKKLKLTSATIAKGTSAPAGEGVSIKMVASAAVRKKLKAATAKTVKVTYTVTATSPITETFKQTVVMQLKSVGVKRLLIRSSGDTFDFGGAGRG